ncbi:OAS1-like protein [Mya arenaria]|uniref:OAS1-like protein n=1 Tax=Mya arenaria TaxID=6604 RepID=A0ABY7G0P7_MYAAR|nr:OAS1-like protein [Mya arenaria]
MDEAVLLPPLRLKRIDRKMIGSRLPGGSLGKGTAVKGKSDIDITLMVSEYSNVRDLVQDMPRILSELEESLQHVPGISVDGKSRHAVQISLGGSSVDILPAVDVTRTGGDSPFRLEVILNEVYQKMIGPDAYIKDFYSASLAPLQTELVRDLPTKVKSLIRLIKYWNKEKVKPTILSGCPTSYVYEVIIMDRWVKAGRPYSFDMTRAAHDVLTSLKNNRDFKVLTTELAKYDRSIAQIGHSTYIMDPCNPTNDLYNSRNWNWDGVASEAQRWLSQQMFQGVSGTAGRLDCEQSSKSQSATEKFNVDGFNCFRT